MLPAVAGKSWLERFPEIVKDAGEELATKIRVSRQAVDVWEKGISLPTLPVFLELARVFEWEAPS
jgi:hypothetical protein